MSELHHTSKPFNKYKVLYFQIKIEDKLSFKKWIFNSSIDIELNRWYLIEKIFDTKINKWRNITHRFEINRSIIDRAISNYGKNYVENIDFNKVVKVLEPNPMKDTSMISELYSLIRYNNSLKFYRKKLNKNYNDKPSHRYKSDYITNPVIKGSNRHGIPFIVN